MTNFNIRQDLEHRSLAEQAEILWISGPTAFDAEAVGRILGVTPEQVLDLVAQSRNKRSDENWQDDGNRRRMGALLT